MHILASTVYACLVKAGLQILSILIDCRLACAALQLPKANWILAACKGRVKCRFYWRQDCYRAHSFQPDPLFQNGIVVDMALSMIQVLHCQGDDLKLSAAMSYRQLSSGQHSLS